MGAEVERPVLTCGRATALGPCTLTEYASECIFFVWCRKIIATDEFTEWYRELSATDVEAVTDAVNVLEATGLSLGYPHSERDQGLALRAS